MSEEAWIFFSIIINRKGMQIVQQDIFFFFREISLFLHRKIPFWVFFFFLHCQLGLTSWLLESSATRDGSSRCLQQQHRGLFRSALRWYKRFSTFLILCITFYRRVNNNGICWLCGSSLPIHSCVHSVSEIAVIESFDLNWLRDLQSGFFWDLAVSFR